MSKNPSKSSLSLGVRQRVEAAYSVHVANNPGVGISVAQICREAKVSRATLYAHHLDLIDKISQLGRRTIDVSVPRQHVSTKLDEAQETIKALRYICIELHLELRRVRSHNDTLASELKELRSRKGR